MHLNFKGMSLHEFKRGPSEFQRARRGGQRTPQPSNPNQEAQPKAPNAPKTPKRSEPLKTPKPLDPTQTPKTPYTP